MSDDCRILHGDVIDMLRTLPDESVQCVVTSPPYWGLRDYGTAAWEGGDPSCKHMHKAGGTGASTLGAASGGNDMSDAARQRSIERSFVPYRDVCAKCGARRVDLQIGLEPTLDEYLGRMVEVFRAVRRVLRNDGVAWVNMGDAYAGNRSYQVPDNKAGDVGNRRGMTTSARRDDAEIPRSDLRVAGLKPKDMMGQPWRLAFALQADGWYLRDCVIWHKVNPMPESVRDRCTKSYEFIFQLSKSERYYFDADAISEEASLDTHARIPGNVKPNKGVELDPDGYRTRGGLHEYAARQRAKYATPSGWATGDGEHSAIAHQQSGAHPKRQLAESGSGTKQNKSYDAAMSVMPERRNRRNVWSIPSEPYPEAHFATFPTEIPRICILAASRTGDLVLDPFNGSGTTGQVALELARRYVGCELNAEYVELTNRRLRRTTLGLPLEFGA